MSAHAFEAFEGSSGMACTAMVLRDGYGTDCGLPGDDPVHQLAQPLTIGGRMFLDAMADPEWGDLTPAGPCYICGDARDHDGVPHGKVTGDGQTRAQVDAIRQRAALRTVATDMLVAYAHAVDAEWGCGHNKLQIRAYLAGDLDALGRNCNATEVVDEWAERLAAPGPHPCGCPPGTTPDEHLEAHHNTDTPGGL